MSHQNFSELHLRGVTRRFDNAGASFAALDGLTVNIKRGEFIAFLGPSGCGKSTALNCVAGLFPLTGGSIYVDDARIDTLPPERRGFGMVFQSYALFPHMTVRDNVGFGLLMRRVPKPEIAQRVKRALELVQLVGQEHKLPGQLSGGQQQRVAIARAIVIEPPLILMDEPLSNLDAKLRLEMRSEIRRIHQELGRSTIYVTHDQDEALSLADRIVVLKDGVTQQIAPPHEVYTQPANLEVARFMGYRNVLEADIIEALSDNRVRLRKGGLTLTGVPQQTMTGKHAYVAMRPEDFVLGGDAGENSFEATVENVEYCGHHSQVDVMTASGQPLHLRTVTGLKVGDPVRLSIPSHRVLVYPR
ncbi:ABC transporter ATP-binding protein [Uliginosibacterium sp. sgz301328]|uniref:ABC transporter ATP-binding protein n=1 Tax=Uliginosibacterium sp. sgz301328 TaxID=3243764 RepID=UPI00359D8D15